MVVLEWWVLLTSDVPLYVALPHLIRASQQNTLDAISTAAFVQSPFRNESKEETR